MFFAGLVRTICPVIGSGYGDAHCITGSGDKTLRVWSDHSKDRVESAHCIMILKGHEGGVTCVATVGEGEVASGSWDKTIRIWDVHTGRLHTIVP